MLELAKTHDFCASNEPALTVVFIHGIADDSGRFKKPLETLETNDSLKNIRFVAFDLLGSGKSLKSDKLNYDFEEQLAALTNSIKKLEIKTPLVLVGHSMGCLISARYADTHCEEIHELVMVSPPVFMPKDFDTPKFIAGKEGFKKLVILKNPALKNDKAFDTELEDIVFNKDNYAVLKRLDRPTTIIYGTNDKIIATFNIPTLLKENPNFKTLKTPGAHGIGHDKTTKLALVLERIVNEII